MLPFIGKYLHKQTNPYTGEETREMANTDVNFLALCCESEDLNIFQSQSLQELIDFKWLKFGKNWHSIGFFFHI